MFEIVFFVFEDIEFRVFGVWEGPQCPPVVPGGSQTTFGNFIIFLYFCPGPRGAAPEPHRSRPEAHSSNFELYIYIYTLTHPPVVSNYSSRHALHNL